MKYIIFITLAFFCSTAFAQPYVQAGSSVYSSDIGAVTSSSIDLGYTSGAVDTSVSVFTARQNTKRGDIHWSGFNVGSTAHLPLAGPVTAYVGYQIAQTPEHSKTNWDGKYGYGLTLHAMPAKLSLVIAPAQRSWDGSWSVKTVGLTLKIRSPLN